MQGALARLSESAWREAEQVLHTFLNCMMSFFERVLVHSFASTLSFLKLKSYGVMISLFPSTTWIAASLLERSDLVTKHAVLLPI